MEKSTQNFVQEKKSTIPYEGNKYNCTIDTLKQTLDTYGVAIIPKLISKKE